MGGSSSKLISKMIVGGGRSNNNNNSYKSLRGRRRNGGGGSSDPSMAAATPKGYVPICVGVNNETARRFIVHTTALGDADFLQFLRKSAEEYGFCNEGILRIPYEAKEFEDWLTRRAIPKVKVKPLF